MTTNETMLQLTDGVDRSGEIMLDALPYVDNEVRDLFCATTSTNTFFQTTQNHESTTNSTTYRV